MRLLAVNCWLLAAPGFLCVVSCVLLFVLNFFFILSSTFFIFET
jgi:hypothetical protein